MNKENTIRSQATRRGVSYDVTVEVGCGEFSKEHGSDDDTTMIKYYIDVEYRDRGSATNIIGFSADFIVEYVSNLPTVAKQPIDYFVSKMDSREHLAAAFYDTYQEGCLDFHVFETSFGRDESAIKLFMVALDSALLEPDEVDMAIVAASILQTHELFAEGGRSHEAAEKVYQSAMHVNFLDDLVDIFDYMKGDMDESKILQDVLQVVKEVDTEPVWEDHDMHRQLNISRVARVIKDL